VATCILSGKFRHVAIALLGLAVGQAELGFSTTLTVSPISVDLGPRAASQLLVIGNQTDRELRFEVSTFLWTEDEQGEMVLARPTTSSSSRCFPPSRRAQRGTSASGSRTAPLPRSSEPIESSSRSSRRLGASITPVR
jgi:hypothetical protein